MSEAAPVTATPAAAPAPAAATTIPATNGQPKPATAPAAEPKTAAELYEIVIDGKPEKMTLDEMKRHAQLGKGSHKKFEEAAKMRQEAEEIVSQMKDPNRVFKMLSDPKFGLSKDQIVKSMEDWYSDNVIKPSEMTPEQLRLKEAEERLKSYEEKEAAAKKQQEEEQERSRDQELAKKLQDEVLECLNGSGLPKTKFTASRLAHWMRINESKGLNAPAELIIEQVRKEARGIMSSMLENADAEMLANLVGEGTIKKIRAYDLERIRAKRGQSSPQPVKEQSFQPQNQNEKISVEEVQRRLRDTSLWK